MKITYKVSFEKDVALWWQTLNIESYNVNWKEMLPVDLDLKNTNKEILGKYLEEKFYQNRKIEKYRELFQQNINSQEIKENLEVLSGKTIPWEKIIAYCTYCPRRPYNFRKKYFYLRATKDIKQAKSSIYHELFHFLFHEYYWAIFEKNNFREQVIHDIKESLTVLLNDILFSNNLPIDKGYLSQSKLRSRIKYLWQKEKNLDRVITILTSKLQAQSLPN